MVPKRKDELSEDDKKKSLRYLMFMKEKCDGTINHGDAPTAGHRIYTQKEEVRSPTVT